MRMDLSLGLGPWRRRRGGDAPPLPPPPPPAWLITATDSAAQVILTPGVPDAPTVAPGDGFATIQE